MKYTVIAAVVGAGMLLAMEYVRADEQCQYNVTLGSTHMGNLDKYPKFNEKNYGIGMECSGVQSGIYHNSLYKPSMYVGSTLPFSKNTGLKFGVVTGYNVPVLLYTAGYVKVYNMEFTIIPWTEYNPLTIGYTYWF